jgi:hypothetical protein
LVERFWSAYSVVFGPTLQSHISFKSSVSARECLSERRLLPGDLDVSMSSGKTYFDFGEWKSEVATKKNPDGTISFVTTVPGMSGFDFVVGTGAKKTLTTRDAQHEYIFEEK